MFEIVGLAVILIKHNANSYQMWSAAEFMLLGENISHDQARSKACLIDLVVDGGHLHMVNKADIDLQQDCSSDSSVAR